MRGVVHLRFVPLATLLATLVALCMACSAAPAASNRGGNTPAPGDADTGGDPIPGDPTVPANLDIPVAHPRLFWTADRLAAAGTWFATHPFTPSGNINTPERALDAAMHSLLSGEAASCRAAIDWAMDVVFTCPGVSCDPARWDGEGALVTFDWCYDHFTAPERATFTDRWNGYTTQLNAKDWGGIGMEGNNYYLGYLRNTIEWAIASYYENAAAPAFLDYALTDRWENSLRPYYDGAAKGGAPHEGSAYGRRVFAYLTLPFHSLTLLGRHVWDETPYFKESVYWIVYSTTPGPTTMDNGAVVYETFPFNEDERWSERDVGAGNTAQTTLGTYLAPLMGHWQGTAIAGTIRRFLDLTGHAIDDRFAAYAYNPTSVPVVAGDLHDLPLDYLASGLGAFYAKTSWDADTTFVTVQASTPVAVGHEHRDAGSFQIWRDGRFLSRETVGYAQDIVGYDGDPIDCGAAVGHNGLLFDGLGTIGYYHHRPTLLRLDSQPEYAYVAIDLTGAYEVAEDWAHREDEVGNPTAGTVVREMLFIRPLDTLVVLDRLAAAGPTPNTVVKTFLVHFPNTPDALDAATYEGVSGDQALRVTTVVPAVTSRRVIDEGGAIGQYRAEIETSGSTHSHFLHVLHAKDDGGADLTIDLAEDADTYTLTLTHPNDGSAIAVFEKGMTSTGGAFGYAASGAPVPTPLRTTVRGLSVSTAGPQWAP